MRRTRIVAVCGKTQNEAQTQEDKDPNRRGRAGARKGRRAPGMIDDGEGTRGVGQVVGAVRKRSSAGRADLKKTKEVFGLVGE